MSNNQQKEGEKNSVRLLIQKLQDVKYKTSTLLCFRKWMMIWKYGTGNYKKWVICLKKEQVKLMWIKIFKSKKSNKTSLNNKT